MVSAGCLRGVWVVGMSGGCPGGSIDRFDRFDSFDSSFDSIDVRYYCESGGLVDKPAMIQKGVFDRIA